MSDFAKFCPYCRRFFRNSDVFVTHVAMCGKGLTAEPKARQVPAKTLSESVPEPTPIPEETTDTQESPESVAESPRRGRPPKFPMK